MADSGTFTVKGHILDIQQEKVFDGKIVVESGKIKDIVPENFDKEDLPYIIPGFIDSHVHIESSMLRPYYFARAARENGVVGAVCDPHEIANVCGKEGIDFMIQDSKKADFHFAFMVPSCVPSTDFETSGHTLGSVEVAELLNREEFFGLAEMMNFPGVLSGDKEVLKKIEASKKAGKPIDGHAPCLDEEDIIKYADSGITTDHECFDINEAETKIRHNIKILIREGSAAKNFEALYPLIDKYPDMTMFCSDDCHPEELKSQHINKLIKRAVENGVSIWNVLKTACVNPVLHYKLPIGLLRKNDSADFITVDNLKDFNIQQVFIKGKKVYSIFDKKDFIQKEDVLLGNNCPNNFCAERINDGDIRIFPKSDTIKVIKVKDKELVSSQEICKAVVKNGNVVPDTDNDILKLVVCNRYSASEPSVAFIKGFNLKNGAIASTVAHDSHNIIAIGTADSLITKAVNKIVEMKGGIVAVNDTRILDLPLDIAGLMSTEPIDFVAKRYNELNKFVKAMGCTLNAPFMTMGFMSLLVIAELKLSDRGLFDVNNFCFTDLFVTQ